jgi:hypothetical protein
MGEVAYRRTIVSPSEALSAIARALPSDAPDVAVRMIGAQSALETAGWGSCANWNFGNTTVLPSSTHDWVHQGTPGSAAYALSFKAFDNIDDGASDMIAWLSSHGCLPYAYAGDLGGYVAKLNASNYFGNAPAAQYQAGMATWMQKLAGVQFSRARFPWKVIALGSRP